MICTFRHYFNDIGGALFRGALPPQLKKKKKDIENEIINTSARGRR